MCCTCGHSSSAIQLLSSSSGETYIFSFSFKNPSSSWACPLINVVAMRMWWQTHVKICNSMHQASILSNVSSFRIVQCSISGGIMSAVTSQNISLSSKNVSFWMWICETQCTVGCFKNDTLSKKKYCNTSMHPSGVYINQIQKLFSEGQV